MKRLQSESIILTFVMIGSLIIVGCTTAIKQELKDAESNLISELTNIETEGIYFIGRKGTQIQKEIYAQNRRDTFLIECMEPAFAASNESFRIIRRFNMPLEFGEDADLHMILSKLLADMLTIFNDDIKAIETGLVECANQHKLDTQFVFILNDNSHIGVTDTLDNVIEALFEYSQIAARLDREEQRIEEAKHFLHGVGQLLMILGAAYTSSVSGSTGRHWVKGHMRNGSYVRGHWRTNPNETCVDNYRGC